MLRREMMQMLILLFVAVSVLVGVAFFTLFERKLLGYIQLRKGPNKVGFIGILQPFADAIKLFCKEHTSPFNSNYYPFFLSPVIALALALLGWICLPSFYNFFSFDLRIIFFLCCVGLGVYILMIAGWSSNSKYSLFGALRGVAQTISYEVRLVLILLGPVLFVIAYDWARFRFWQSKSCFFMICPLSCLVWGLSCLAETNRTPFDFAEGESELVSGYNTEYGRGGFALLMLSEYTRILFMSFLLQIIFFEWGNLLLDFMRFLIIAFAFVWVRGTLPRFRYDKLIGLAWKIFLPYSLLWLVLVIGLISVFISK